MCGVLQTRHSKYVLAASGLGTCQPVSVRDAHGDGGCISSCGSGDSAECPTHLSCVLLQELQASQSGANSREKLSHVTCLSSQSLQWKAVAIFVLGGDQFLEQVLRIVRSAVLGPLEIVSDRL
jgi:hypothetical protein